MAKPLVILTDQELRPGLLLEIKTALGEASPLSPMTVHPKETAGQHLLVDVDLNDARAVQRLQKVLAEGRPARMVFLVDAGSRAQTVQAHSLGASEVLVRPVPAGMIIDAFTSSFDQVAVVDRAPLRSTAADPVDAAIENSQFAAASLQSAFGGFMQQAAFDGATFDEVSGIMAADIERIGIDRWLCEVRLHHAGTYQHCLTVAGLGAAFGRHLGMGPGTVRRLAIAGLVHDIGKARISPLILDKPGMLTDAEMAIMRQHPTRGFTYLKAHSDLDDQLLEVVLRHHELLDGSGYPDGHAGGRIHDMTRIMTICDIHAALIELRSYKLPMKSDAAYAILQRMSAEGKLDPALTESFKAVALGIETETPGFERRQARA